MVTLVMDALSLLSDFDHHQIGTLRCRRVGASTPSEILLSASNPQFRIIRFVSPFMSLRVHQWLIAETFDRRFPQGQGQCPRKDCSEPLLRRDGHDRFETHAVSSKSMVRDELATGELAASKPGARNCRKCLDSSVRKICS